MKSNLAAKGQKKAKGMSVFSNMDTESKMSDMPNKKKAKSDQATKGCKKVKGTSVAAKGWKKVTSASAAAKKGQKKVNREMEPDGTFDDEEDNTDDDTFYDVKDESDTNAEEGSE